MYFLTSSRKEHCSNGGNFPLENALNTPEVDFLVFFRSKLIHVRARIVVAAVYAFRNESNRHDGKNLRYRPSTQLCNYLHIFLHDTQA